MARPNLKQLQQQVTELTEALQRERADSVNLRRRTDEERAQLANVYKVMILSELLPAIDNLERAISHKPKDLSLASSDSRLQAWQEWARGMTAVRAQFEKALASLGVERIKTKGERFDPNVHEAVHMEDPSISSGQAADELVSEEIQAGYKIGDEVIRPAQVKVKKG